VVEDSLNIPPDPTEIEKDELGLLLGRKNLAQCRF
jgi:hypothetical protein